MFQQLNLHFMTRSFFFAVAVCALFGCGKGDSADSSSLSKLETPTTSGLGFNRIEKAGTSPISASLPSVVRIAFPSGNYIPLENFTNDRPVVISRVYQSFKNNKNMDSVLRDLILLQLKTCMNQLAYDCRLKVTVTRATGFLIGNGSQIATTFGNLVPYLRQTMPADDIYNSRRESLVGMRLPILVYNQSGRLISDETAVVTLASTSNAAADLLRDPAITLNSADNFAVLQSNRSLGIPIPRAKPDDLSQIASIGGYPEPTFDRAARGVKDADGEHLYFSRGFIVNKTPSDLEVRADSATGMEGGPILNDKGEFIGMLVRTSPDLSTKSSFGISFTAF